LSGYLILLKASLDVKALILDALVVYVCLVLLAASPYLIACTEHGLVLGRGILMERTLSVMLILVGWLQALVGP
jgi:hypothetical protein